MEKLLLTQDETFYQRLIETLPVAFYSCDREGRITFFNNKAIDLWGRVPDLGSVRFCACYKVWLPDGSFVPPEKTPMALALESGESFQNVEAWVERPNGTRFYASVNVNPLYDSEGNLTGAINVFQDISSWKLAEAALLDSEDRYHDLIKSLSAAVYTCDALGYVTLFNDAAVGLWGREPKIGEDLWCGSLKIYRLDGTPMPFDECPMAKTIKEGRSVDGEIIIIEQPDGSRRYVAPHPRPIFDQDGKVKGAVNMLLDVTEEIRTGLVLRENEERLRLAIDAAELGTWDMDIATGIVITSDRHRQIIGYEKGIDWDRSKFLRLVHPDDLSLVEEAFENAMKSGKLFYEARIITQDNQTRWIRINGVTISNDGIPFRILGTIMDITLQRESRAELEKTIVQRTRELTRLNQQLEKSNYDLEQFAYIASHDLQEPLRKIQTFVTLLEQVEGEEDRRKYISKIRASAKSMSGLIKDVLMYSRLSKIPDFEYVDLNEIAENVKNDFELLIQEKNAVIKVGNLPAVLGNSRQMQQLFSNIINNSLKFSAEDPLIEIYANKLSKEEVELNPALSRRREYLQLTFKDNGIGFEQKYAEQIFSIFQRLNTKEAYPGSGVGLALCKKIVENHHGIIMARGEVGRGATIMIILPY